jgi:hypothetical protein
MYNVSLGDIDKAMQPISEDLVSFIETNTKQQAGSDLWIRLHDYRISSSLFGDVLRATNRCSSLIKRIMKNR